MSLSGSSFVPQKHMYSMPHTSRGRPILVYSKKPNSRRPISFRMPFATMWGVVPTSVMVPPREAKNARAISSLDFLTPALEAMELTMGIRQAVEPVSFRNADRPPATRPVPSSRPFSVLPSRPMILPPIKSARPVLKKASPTTTRPMKNTMVVLPNSV